MTQVELLRALAPYRIKGHGDKWRAQCPAHQGKDRNLVITCKDGLVLFTCHSHQCSYEDIILALGVEPKARSLPEDLTPHENSRLVEYKTLDRAGRLVATHKRTLLPNGKKDRVLGWFDSNGKPGLNGLPTNELPLYGSQKINSFDPSKPVDICEGQPATEVLLSLHAQALGTYGTGNEPSLESLSWVKGFPLRLWPDNDPLNGKGLRNGVEHMRAVAKVALLAGATKVILLDTSSLPPKGDAVEWREAMRALGTSGQDLREQLKGEEVPGLPPLEVYPVAPQTQPKARTLEEFMALRPKPRESLCGNWFRTGSLVMISGDSGAGKTWFCLDLALSVSSGVPFMGRWSVPKARKVLLVSGEDDIDDLQERLSPLLKAKEKAAGKSLSYLLTFLNTHDLELLPNGLPNLGTPEGRAKVEAQLEGVELVILDNYGVLFNGVEENDAKEFAPIQDWLFWFKTRGISVLLVSHTGKNGDHRGSSKKVDGLNASLLLNHPSTWKARDGASFELKFKKSRDARGVEVDSFAAKLGEDEDGDLCWLFDEAPPTTQATPKPAPKTTAILELHAQGKTAKEMIEAGYSKTKVYFVLASLKKSAPKVEGGDSRIPVPSHPKGCVTGHGKRDIPPTPSLVPSINSRQETGNGKRENTPIPTANAVNSKQDTQKPESTGSTGSTDGMVVDSVDRRQTQNPGSTAKSGSTEESTESCKLIVDRRQTTQSPGSFVNSGSFDRVDKGQSPIDRGEDNAALLYGSNDYQRKGYTPDPEEEECPF